MKVIGRAAAAAAMALAIAATPAIASMGDKPAASPASAEKDAKMADFAAKMAGMFQAAPLDAAQQGRLPAARGVVQTAMPDGFYARMMERSITGMIAPVMAQFSTPDAVIAQRTGIDADRLARLDSANKARIAATLDPGYASQGETVVKAMSAVLGQIGAQLEPPMRDGLSRAYAVRFDDRQLADIAAFFATPTGAAYASESTQLLADPQVMAAMMQSLLLVMRSMGSLETQMKQSFAALPQPRKYTDLSRAERDQVATLLGITVRELDASAAKAAAE